MLCNPALEVIKRLHKALIWCFFHLESCPCFILIISRLKKRWIQLCHFSRAILDVISVQRSWCHSISIQVRQICTQCSSALFTWALTGTKSHQISSHWDVNNKTRAFRDFHESKGVFNAYVTTAPTFITVSRDTTISLQTEIVLSCSHWTCNCFSWSWSFLLSHHS